MFTALETDLKDRIMPISPSCSGGCWVFRFWNKRLLTLKTNLESEASGNKTVWMCLFISHQKEQLQNWFFKAKFKLDRWTDRVQGCLNWLWNGLNLKLMPLFDQHWQTRPSATGLAVPASFIVLFLMPLIRSDSDLSMLDSCRSAVDELRFHSLKKEAKGTKRSSLVSPSFCPQWLPESAKKMKGPYRSLNIYISSLFFKISLILLLYFIAVFKFMI